MRPEDLAPFIDHACLQPDATTKDVERASAQALQYGFRGLVVPSGAVNQAKRHLMNTGVKVIATVGFPHGNSAPDIKAHAAMRAAAMGADEIDYVICVGAAREGNFRFIREEGVAILRKTRGKLIKAILEVGYLTEEQRYECAKALADAGVPYVKTCTGFGPGQATPEDVRLLARAVAGKALIKASGGIRERWQVMELLSAGAAVIGTSHGPQIISF